MAAKGPDSLEKRVREGASAFEFHALVNTPLEEAPSPRAMEDKFESYLSSPAAASEPARSLEMGSSDETAAAVNGNLKFSVMAIVSALIVLAVGGWALFLRQSSMAVPARSAGASPAPPGDAHGQPNNGIGLPRATLTPGERSPRPTIGLVVPESVRQKVFAAYGIDPQDNRHIPIRLIPAALGGTNSEKNVFPVTPWFAGLKARLDGYLVDEVRAGRMTPAQADAELTSDWIKSCHRHYIRNYGERDTDKARKTEDQLRWK